MGEQPRYRVEDERHCIDLRLASLEQVFDNRDPAPFRERDLDPDLVEYLVASAEDLAHAAIQVVFWVPRGTRTSELELAYRAHFEYELERNERRRRRDRRDGEVSLVVGVGLLLALVTLGQLVAAVPRVGAALKEGLTISAWVVLWLPIQTLVYGWWPAHRQRKAMRRLHEAPVIIREDGEG